VKFGMDFNGYFGGPARLPLLPLTGDVRKEIESLLADIRN
jgi:4-hydroxy-2-oxoglutarate aldolase